MGDTLEYLTFLERYGSCDGGDDYYIDAWDEGWCDGEMIRVPGSPRDNKRYRCTECGAIRQKNRPHRWLSRDKKGGDCSPPSKQPKR